VRVDSYRRVLAIRPARNALLLGILLRVPMFASAVVLTLHVVATLHRSYAQAGVVSAVATVCIAISGPWRGRLLDRIGLRRVVLPSVIIEGACWAIAPFGGYWPLLALAALAGLFTVPSFSIVRQAVIAAVPESDRRTALALDSVAVEVSFMIGPLVGVWAATTWATSWVLFTIAMSGVAAGVALWIVNLPIKAAARVTAPPRTDSWYSPAFVAVCAAAAAATVVLSGTDIAIVAALRHFDAGPMIGLVLTLWGFGSMAGGLVYGALHRAIPAFVLLAGLAVATLPIALARDTWTLAVLALVAGLVCAPTITATVDQLSRVVPETARGEAMGWHGSALTAGSALGAPLAGVAIDGWGAGGGFVIVSVVGLAVAVVGYAVTARRARLRIPELAASRTG
jgi:MFS family permease